MRAVCARNRNILLIGGFSLGIISSAPETSAPFNGLAARGGAAVFFREGEVFRAAAAGLGRTFGGFVLAAGALELFAFTAFFPEGRPRLRACFLE